MSGRWFSAQWLGSVDADRALELGDPFASATWFTAHAHACATLGLEASHVQVREVEDGYESRECPYEAEEEGEQASGVRLRVIEGGAKEGVGE